MHPLDTRVLIFASHVHPGFIVRPGMREAHHNPEPNPFAAA
jgi:hypothetical protein